MPTYDSTERFKQQFARLTSAEQAAFMRAVAKFVQDLRRGGFRKGLRVKRLRSTDEWEMTWAPDGRAVFVYGEPLRPGEQHVEWQRIGSHDILNER